MDVLIVEDQAPVRSAMGEMLHPAGYTCHAVENGLAALAAVQESRYRAIICDLGLPLIDGVRFYKYLESGYPDLAKQVLRVSAVGGPPTVREFLSRTDRPLLEKPFEICALVREVAQLIDRPLALGALL